MRKKEETPEVKPEVDPNTGLPVVEPEMGFDKLTQAAKSAPCEEC